jgi:hypothetical protein
VTGTGTGANVVTISLPVTMLTAMNDANIHLGSGHIFDVSASTKYRGWVVPASTTTVKLLTAHSTTDGLLGTTDFTAALASGDTVSVSGWYEAA